MPIGLQYVCNLFKQSAICSNSSTCLEIVVFVRVKINLGFGLHVCAIYHSIGNIPHIPHPRAVSHVTPPPLRPPRPSAPRQDGPFIWSELTQGVILSSYFGGYMVSQIPAGRLAERLGAVRVLAAGLGTAGLLTLLTPTCALWGVHALVAIRFAQGAASVSGEGRGSEGREGVLTGVMWL